MIIKIETKTGNIVDVDLDKELNKVIGSAGYTYNKLIKNAQPHLTYSKFSSIMADTITHAEKEREYANSLRQDAPYSTTYSFYSFYHRGILDPDLELMKLIEQRLNEVDKNLGNEKTKAEQSNNLSRMAFK